MEDKPCFIVGGGPSLQNFDYGILEGRDVIAVNQAIWKVPKAKYFITMDYTWLAKGKVQGLCSDSKRAQFIQHPAKKYFVLAFSGERLGCVDAFHYRDKLHKLDYDLTLFDEVIKAFKYGGIGFSLNEFHCGSDSGYSALQLAAVLGYKTIYLLGLDFCVSGENTHCHTDYPRQDYRDYQGRLDSYLQTYPEAFQVLKQNGIRVFSSSHVSKLNQFILYFDLRNL